MSLTIFSNSSPLVVSSNPKAFLSLFLNDFIEAYLSKHPFLPHTHSIPFFSIIMCPNSYPERVPASNNFPSKNAAPPIPVPKVKNKLLLYPFRHP